MDFQLINFFDAELKEAIAAEDLSLKLTGELNTLVSLSEKALALILHDGQQDPEIVYAVGKSGDDIIILRGRENTAAKNWLKGSRVINALTADTIPSSVSTEDLDTAVEAAQTAATAASASSTAAQTAQAGAELAESTAITASSNSSISATQAVSAAAEALTAKSAAVDAKIISVSASLDAQQFANAASNSLTAAQTAVSTAEQKATIATTQANIAATQAGNAQTAANQSAASATAAGLSESNAATSATAAATSNTSAGNSATAAATSASGAATSATNAATSASAAHTDALSAGTNAANAGASATTAVNAKNDVVTGLAAQATQIASLTTTVNANTASITSEASTRASADTALGNLISALTVRTTNAEAAITSEATARSTADAVNASAISGVAANLSIYGPNNILQNTDLVTTDGWSTGGTLGVAASQLGRNLPSNDWQISKVINNLTIHQIGHDPFDRAWVQDCPIKPQEWYNASTLYACHRAAAELRYRFLDANGTPITDLVSLASAVGQYIGGTDESNWGILSKTTQAPAGAAYLRVRLQKDATADYSVSDDSYAWFCKPMVAVVPPNAPDTRPKYVAGGTAQVISAIQASITDTRSVALDASGRAYALAGTQATVNGRTGGFVLDNNGVVIGFQITADTFAFKTPSAGNKTLFGYDGSKFYFTADVKINGSLIVDGTVNTNSIADGSVTNIQVFSSADSFQPTANDTWFNVGSKAIMTTGKPVRVDFAVFGWANTLISSNANNGVSLRIRRDGTTIFENGIGGAEIITVGEVQFVQQYNGGFSFTIFDIPAAGAHTYYLDIMASNKDYAGISYPLLALQEQKK